MRKTLTRLLIVAVLIAVAYVAGYWQQHVLLNAANRRLGEVQQQLDRSRALVRTARLQNQLLTIIDQTGQQNYGTAQELSKQFFDGVRETQTSNAAEQALLQRVLETRDQVTSGLARADASVLASLRNSLGLFRAFLDQEAKP